MAKCVINDVLQFPNKLVAYVIRFLTKRPSLYIYVSVLKSNRKNFTSKQTYTIIVQKEEIHLFRNSSPSSHIKQKSNIFLFNCEGTQNILFFQFSIFYVQYRRQNESGLVSDLQEEACIEPKPSAHKEWTCLFNRRRALKTEFAFSLCASFLFLHPPPLPHPHPPFYEE